VVLSFFIIYNKIKNNDIEKNLDIEKNEIKFFVNVKYLSKKYIFTLLPFCIEFYILKGE
jgi:hypothetical protein